MKQKWLALALALLLLQAWGWYLFRHQYAPQKKADQYLSFYQTLAGFQTYFPLTRDFEGLGPGGLEMVQANHPTIGFGRRRVPGWQLSSTGGSYLEVPGFAKILARGEWSLSFMVYLDQLPPENPNGYFNLVWAGKQDQAGYRSIFSLYARKLVRDLYAGYLGENLFSPPYLLRNERYHHVLLSFSKERWHEAKVILDGEIIEKLTLKNPANLTEKDGGDFLFRVGRGFYPSQSIDGMIHHLSLYDQALGEGEAYRINRLHQANYYAGTPFYQGLLGNLEELYLKWIGAEAQGLAYFDQAPHFLVFFNLLCLPLLVLVLTPLWWIYQGLLRTPEVL